MKSLSGKRILVVEDDYLLATDLEETLREAGAQVIGPYGSEGEALRNIQSLGFDAVVMDINLGTAPSFEPARALHHYGTPFLFLTGYDLSAVPADLKDVPLFRKPADMDRLIETLAVLLGVDA